MVEFNSIKAFAARFLEHKIFFAISLGVYISIAVIGVIRFFSPVPYWDMWDGGLEWFLSRSTSIQDFWIQHNEHRIFFTHALFFLDFKFGNGTGAGLVAVNLLLLTALGICLYRIARRETDSYFDKWLIFTLSIFFALSWSQNDNMHWSFQSQFVLAFLLPAIAFLMLAKFLRGRAKKNLVLSLIFAALSSGTMANGVLVLPIVLLILLIYKVGLKVLIPTLLLWLLVLFAYFDGYKQVVGHESPFLGLIKSPLAVFGYFLAYLGNPISLLASDKKAGLVLAASLGLAVLVWYLLLLKNTFKKSEIHSIAAFGLASYIIGTAAVTSLGRVSFGLESALSSRYATPSLAIIFLFVIATVIHGNWKFGEKKLLFFVTAALLFVIQLSGLTSSSDVIRSRDRAGIALAMGVQDVAAVATVYPDYQRAKQIATKAKSEKISVFGSESYLKLADYKSDKSSPRSCTGFVDVVERVEGTSGDFYVQGWALPGSSSGSGGEVLYVFNSQGKKIGAGLLGEVRTDVAAILGPRALFSGFSGYVTMTNSDDLIEAGTKLNSC